MMDHLYQMTVGKQDDYINPTTTGYVSWRSVQSSELGSELAWEDWQQGGTRPAHGDVLMLAASVGLVLSSENTPPCQTCKLSIPLLPRLRTSYRKGEDYPFWTSHYSLQQPGGGKITAIPCHSGVVWQTHCGHGSKKMKALEAGSSTLGLPIRKTTCGLVRSSGEV